MIRRLLVGSVIAVAACVQPVTAPKPTTLHVTRPAADVVRLAARTLTSDGFEITTSDGTTGVLTAKLARSAADLDSLVKCGYRTGSMAGAMAHATLSVHVSASPSAGGSDVVVGSAVHVVREQPPLGSVESDTDCASSGLIERQIAAVLTSPPGP